MYWRSGINCAYASGSREPAKRGERWDRAGVTPASPASRLAACLSARKGSPPGIRSESDAPRLASTQSGSGASRPPRLACVPIAGCGESHASANASRTYAVTERDFHIEAPATLSPGTYTFDVANEGATHHELIIAPTHERLAAAAPGRTDGRRGSDRIEGARVARAGRPGCAAHADRPSGARTLRVLLQHGGALHGGDARRSGGPVMLGRRSLAATDHRVRLRPASGDRDLRHVRVDLGGDDRALGAHHETLGAPHERDPDRRPPADARGTLRRGNAARARRPHGQPRLHRRRDAGLGGRPARRRRRARRQRRRRRNRAAAGRRRRDPSTSSHSSSGSSPTSPSTGEAVLARRATAGLPETAGEHVSLLEPIARLRVLAALSSSIAFRAAQEIGRTDESNIAGLLRTPGRCSASAACSSRCCSPRPCSPRRGARVPTSAASPCPPPISSWCSPTAAPATSAARCPRSSVAPSPSSTATGCMHFVHEDDRAVIEAVRRTGEPSAFTFRMRNVAGEWRHLEARATDLRADRNLRGVVIHARDTTDRVRLEQELTAKVRSRRIRQATSPRRWRWPTRNRKSSTSSSAR